MRVLQGDGITVTVPDTPRNRRLLLKAAEVGMFRRRPSLRGQKLLLEDYISSKGGKLKLHLPYEKAQRYAERWMSRRWAEGKLEGMPWPRRPIYIATVKWAWTHFYAAIEPGGKEVRCWRADDRSAEPKPEDYLVDSKWSLDHLNLMPF